MSVDNFEVAKREIDILQYVQNHLGSVPVRRGNTSFISCPFGSDTSPSFAIYDDHYHCYHCGSGGSIIDLVMNLRGYSSPFDALKELNDLYPALNLLDEANIRRINKRDSYFQWSRRKMFEYRENLLADGTWYARLQRMRGFSTDTIEHFKLGLATHYEYPRLVIPVMGDRDLVYAFITRKLHQDDDNPKYLMRNVALDSGGKIIYNGNIPNDAIHIFRKNESLYNLASAKKASPGSVILVEGQFDVIAAHELGFEHAVAYGTKTISEAQVELLKPFNHVILIPDTDALDTVEKNLQTIRQQIPHMPVGIVDLREMPGVKDVGDLLKVARKQSLISDAIRIMSDVWMIEKWLWEQEKPVVSSFQRYNRAIEILKSATETTGRAWLVTRIAKDLDIDPQVYALMERNNS